LNWGMCSLTSSSSTKPPQVMLFLMPWFSIRGVLKG
jgi:hypothetical protein